MDRRLKSKTEKKPEPAQDPNKDLRHVRPRDGQPEDLQQARREARRRRRRRLMIQRIGLVSAIVLLVALIATAVAIKLVADQKTSRGETVKFLAVRKIVVEGDSRYTDEEIIKASKLYVGQSLLSINKIEACQNLLDAMPYLRRDGVEISNASFYNLRIRISDVPMAAVVACDDKWMILGEDNRALEQVTEEQIPDGAVRIKGATFVEKKVGSTLLDERSLRICSTLIAASRTYGLDSMTTIDISERTNIALLLEERMQVVLGTETNLTNQVSAMVDILPTLYDHNGADAAGRLDMRFYTDSDKKNDKAIYTPQEVLNKLLEAQQTPMAAIQTGDMWTVINDENLALENMPEEYLPEDLVRVIGVTCEIVEVGDNLLDLHNFDVCQTLIQSAAREDNVHLAKIDLTDKTEITVQLREGLTVLFGDATALEAQMDALAEELPDVWAEYGDSADGVLDMTAYADDDPDNDVATYTA